MRGAKGGENIKINIKLVKIKIYADEKPDRSINIITVDIWPRN